MNGNTEPSRTGFADEYPFRSHFLDLEGVRYHYVDEGAGETLLFVHGNPTWSFAWRNFVKALSPRYRTIAVDHVGCGFSDKPADYPYRLEQHVRNLDRLVTALDLQRVTLVGHDWGGAIGTGAALRQPDRFSRFILMNTAAFRSQRIPLRIAVCRIPVLGAIGVRGLNLFSRAALRMAVAHPELMTPAISAGYLAPYDSWAHRVAVMRFVEDIPLKPTHPSYGTLSQIEQGLPSLAAKPWLFLWGDKDWCFTPQFLEEFRQFIPNAEVERYADAGHYIFEDAGPRAIARIEKFLSERPAS